VLAALVMVREKKSTTSAGKKLTSLAVREFMRANLCVDRLVVQNLLND
jgi:hypothetical protein